MPYWFAGQLLDSPMSIAPHAPALTYGASVFTTLRVYESSLQHPLTAWDWHCDRISNSLQTFNWPQPEWPRVLDGCHALLSHYPVLRLTILTDGCELITGRPLPSNLIQQQTQGVTTWAAQGAQYQRSLPHYKTGNYLPCWLAMQAAKTQGARDAILVSPAGEWLETSTGNLWGYANGRWCTPPLSSGLLPGISRARLIQAFKSIGQDVTKTPWTADVVKKFECLAYSNCVVEVLPIHTVEIGKIKLNYSSNHKGLNALRQMFYRPLTYDTAAEQTIQNSEMR